MKCICCDKKSIRYSFVLSNPESHVSISIPIDYDICVDCFDTKDIHKVISMNHVNFKQERIAGIIQEKHLNGVGLTRKDVVSYKEAFDLFQKNKVSGSKTNNPKEMKRIINAIAEPRRIISFLIPDGETISGQIAVYKRIDIENICQTHFTARWVAKSTHELERNQIDDLIGRGFAKEKNGTIFFAQNLKTNERPCSKCGQVKCEEEFRKAYHSIIWKCLPCEAKFRAEDHQKNKEHNLQRIKEWKLANPEKEKSYRKKPATKLSRNVRRRLGEFLKSNKEEYSKTIGRSPEQLRIYIESLWQEGMSWENYSNDGWHIDHIVPISKWKEFRHLITDDKYASPNLYLNLQPLWAMDNILKGNKILPEHLPSKPQ